MKFQEEYVLKCLYLRIFQYTLCLGVDQTDRIMVLVKEWSPNGNLRKFDTTFRIDYTYEKELIAALP